MSSLYERELQPFVVSDVRVTGRVLGEGSYGSVEEAEIPGATCVVKKLHEALLPPPTEAHGADRMAATFVAECRLMSTVRHPHIVQFLGVCLLPGSRLPALIMEKLLIDLHNLLENNSAIPLSMKHSILLGVSKGLTYLHTRSPAIIHRDLSARNVLLNSAMVAKIADLGNSRIINVRPSQLMTMTKNPGNMWYMPPEAQDDASKYNTSIDVFSFGNLSLFTLTQQFPKVKAATYTDPRDGRVIGLTEVERRVESFDWLHHELGRNHPLVDLAEECLQNLHTNRPPITEVLQRLEEFGASVQDPYIPLNKLEMIQLHKRALQSQEAQILGLQQRQKELEGQLAQKEDELRRMETERQLLIGRQQLKHDEEVTQRELVGLESQLSQLQAGTGLTNKHAGSLPSAATANIVIPRAVIGKQRTITIQARNARGEPYTRGGEDVQAELIRYFNGHPVSTKVHDNRDGTYLISFTTQHHGYHKLEITIEKQLIKGSPYIIFSRQARSYIALSAPVNSFDCSGYPQDIAISENRDLYISLSNGSIEVLNPSGKSICIIEGRYNGPFGIALQGVSEVLYIAEAYNHCVQKCTLTGTLIHKFGSQGNGAGELCSPHGVCVDDEGRVFVADRGNSRVSVFSSDGRFLYHIVGSSDKIQLKEPFGLAFDPSGNLHVVDYRLGCVVIFSPKGDYLTHYGRGKFNGAAYIAIDEEGYCFISEFCNKLLVFDLQHTHIHTFADVSSAGVTLDKVGYVYVANYYKQQVLKL